MNNKNYICIIDCITISLNCMIVENSQYIAETQNQTSKKTMDFKVKYKTEKCRYYSTQGTCPFGDMCAFVHDDFEMRQKAAIYSRYKTKKCLNFTKYGTCKYGDRCLFLHKLPEVKPQTRDRERTRSNSPDSNAQQRKNLKKQRKDLQFLVEFGSDVYCTHKNITKSRVIKKSFADQLCELAMTKSTNHQIWESSP